jgi:hypothetical protein
MIDEMLEQEYLKNADLNELYSTQIKDLTTSYQGIKRHKKTKEFYKACLEKMIV